MLILTFAFGLSVLLIVLGFVALLKQKTYLDAATQQPVQVEIPVIGKVKTNYPALIFVLLGFAMGWSAFEKSFPPRKAEWTVKGTFKNPSTNKVEWKAGTLTLTPSDLNTTLYDQGSFEMTALIDEGKSIEDVYETLDFSLANGSVQVDLKKEVAAFHQGQSNHIATLTPHTVTFNPMDIQLYPQEQ